MLKETVQYVDFNGKEQEETLYFNLTEAEVVRLDVQFENGLIEHLQSIKNDAETGQVDGEVVLDTFEKLMLASYGEKSDDGRHFFKSEERKELFFQSAVYSALFVELVTNATKGAKFFTELVTPTTVAPIEK